MDARHAAQHLFRNPVFNAGDEPLQLSSNLCCVELTFEVQVNRPIFRRNEIPGGVNSYDDKKPKLLDYTGEKEEQPGEPEERPDDVGSAVEKKQQPFLPLTHGQLLTDSCESA